MHRKRKWSGMLFTSRNAFLHLCFFNHYLCHHLWLQVRFELTFFALNPELKVVAPWREWEITGREDAIKYAKKHNVPVPVSRKSIYSRDRNIWHLSHEVSWLFHWVTGEPIYDYLDAAIPCLLVVSSDWFDIFTLILPCLFVLLAFLNYSIV